MARRPKSPNAARKPAAKTKKLTARKETLTDLTAADDPAIQGGISGSNVLGPSRGGRSGPPVPLTGVC